MKPLIVALDVETDKEALHLVRRLSPWVDVFKVGPVLFLKYGGDLLQRIRKSGSQVFLDLKFHDIPSVVERAVKRAAEWGVYSATVHAGGGRKMMARAASVPRRPRLWGVTVLTSLDQHDLRRLGVAHSVSNQVARLAREARSAGLDGVVASAEEAALVRKIGGKKFNVVTPGIRLAAAGDDQKRAQTPRRALDAGADFIVMGRPIIEARDPVHVVKSVYESAGIDL